MTHYSLMIHVQLVEVCTDDLPQIANDCGVTNIPTIQFYSSNGEVLETLVGCVAKSVLLSAMDKVFQDIVTNGASIGEDGSAETDNE